MPAGSDSNAPDGMLLYQGKEYKLEIKLDKAADFGQGSLSYDPKKKWIVAGSKTESGEAMRQFLESIGADKLINRTWTKAPRKGNVPDEKMTKKDVKFDYDNFPNKYVPVSAKAIADYYNTKKTYYIQIGGAGLFYMGKDVAEIGCPEFKPDVQLRIRLKRGGSMPIYNYRFSTALQVKKIDKSTMDLDNKLDIQAMAARSKSK